MIVRHAEKNCACAPHGLLQPSPGDTHHPECKGQEINVQCPLPKGLKLGPLHLILAQGASPQSREVRVAKVHLLGKYGMGQSFAEADILGFAWGQATPPAALPTPADWKWAGMFLADLQRELQVPHDHTVEAVPGEPRVFYGQGCERCRVYELAAQMRLLERQMHQRAQALGREGLVTRTRYTVWMDPDGPDSFSASSEFLEDYADRFATDFAHDWVKENPHGG